MSSLSQFFPTGSGTPVHGFVYAGSTASPSGVSSTGNQVYVKSGATVYGAPAATIAKVQSGAAPGYAMPSNGIFSNYSSGLSAGVSMVYNNGIWLRSTASGLYRSTDALSWVPIIFNNDNAGQYLISSKIVFMNNIFMFMAVPVSYTLHTPRVYSSADGITWTSFNIGPATVSANQTTISVANGTVFAVLSSTGAFKPVIYISTDSLTWKPINTAGFSNSFRLNEVAFGNSKYIVTSPDTSQIYGSTDGITWATSGSGAASTQARYINSLWVLLGNSGSGVIYTSVDGTTWTLRTSNVASDLLRVEFAFGLFVAMGVGGVCTTSPTGTTWTSRTSNVTGSVTGLVSFNSLLVAQHGTSGGYSTSPDGITWTARTGAYTGNQTFSAPQYNSPIATDGTTLLAIQGTSNGQIATSTNGTTYNQLLNTGSLTTVNGDAGIQLVNGRLFQLPGTGGIQTADPATHAWKLVLNSGSVFFSGGIAFGNGVFVAAGSGGNIYSSTDGISWTSRTSGTSNQFTAIAYANGLFVAVGASTCRTSPDGTTWTTRASMSISATQVLYANNTWLVYNGALATQTSVDGVTWVNTVNSLPSTYSYVKVAGDIFIFLVISANTGRYCIFDGINFTELGAGTASTYCSDAVESNGTYYIIQTDGLMYTAPGKSAALSSSGWTQQTAIAASAAIPSQPGFTPLLAQNGAGLVKGPQNELFFFGTTQVAASPDGGIFTPFNYIVPGNFTAAVLSPNYRMQIIVGSNYAYAAANAASDVGYIFFNRNSLTSAYPSVTEGALRTGNATANFAALTSYRRIA